MTAEDKCRVCKDLLKWGKNTEDTVRYMEERIYAVKAPNGVMLVEASSAQEAAQMGAQGNCKDCAFEYQKGWEE